jgi:hypothetical protein
MAGSKLMAAKGSKPPSHPAKLADLEPGLISNEGTIVSIQVMPALDAGIHADGAETGGFVEPTCWPSGPFAIPALLGRASMHAPRSWPRSESAGSAAVGQINHRACGDG